MADMLFLSGVLPTDFRRRKHVHQPTLPCVWDSGLYRYVRTEYGEGAVTFTVSQPRKSYRCPECGSAEVIGRGKRRRRFRTVPVGRKRVYVALAVPRVECRVCGAKIEAVATDMSPAYIEAVVTHLPEATLVFDRFHVIKLYNEKLSNLRRSLFRELTDMMQKKALKGVRWLLLKRPENLDPSRKEPERLQEALRLTIPRTTPPARRAASADRSPAARRSSARRPSGSPCPRPGRR